MFIQFRRSTNLYIFSLIKQVKHFSSVAYFRYTIAYSHALGILLYTNIITFYTRGKTVCLPVSAIPSMFCRSWRVDVADHFLYTKLSAVFYDTETNKGY